MTMTSPQVSTREVGFAQVLVPVDLSAQSWQAIPLARSLADSFGSLAQVLHVDTASPWRAEYADRSRLERAPDGALVEVEVLAARTAADGILQALSTADPALLVMATHGRTAAAEMMTGSTAEEVLRRWDGPAVAVGQRYRSNTTLERIVICVEPSLPPPARLLADVGSWSAQLDLPVTVFAVTSDTLRRERARDAERLDRVARAVSLQGRSASIVSFGSGSVAGNVIDFADAVPGTLIAIAPHVRSRAERLITGSVTMAVCRRSQSPVLLRRFGPLDSSSHTFRRWP